MGCLCSKAAFEENRESSITGLSSIKTTSDLKVSRSNLSNFSRREEVIGGKEKVEIGEGKVFPIDKQLSAVYREARIEKKQRERLEHGVLDNQGIRRVPGAVEGERVASGWPSWLAAAAPEAIEGWVPRRADTFEKLEKIGQGTYSSVYKARDLIHDKIVAIKRVRFDNLDPESVKFMAREIFILRRLDHPNVIKLEGLITSATSCSLYLIFEYMEHDLTGLASRPDVQFTEPQVKCYMQQLFSGLEHCHSRGVLHRDIKGSNLLIDNDGILKIADFGLAAFYDPNHKVPLTSRVVTLWYRPPELLLGAFHYGVAVDLWSSGCILGELCTGKPILPGKTEVEQLHKIFKLCGTPSDDYWRKLQLHHSTVFKPPLPYRRRVTETFKDLPAPTVGLLDTLLSLDPAHRGTAAGALKSEFFTTKPSACDPSSLPKYPPSKEIDAKYQDEARRKETGAVTGQRADRERRGPAESRRNSTYSRVDSTTLTQKGPRLSNSNSQTEFLDVNREKSYSGFLVNPHKQQQAMKEPIRNGLEPNHRGTPHSGPLVYASGWRMAGNQLDNQATAHSSTSLSSATSLVQHRTLIAEKQRQKSRSSQLAGKFSGSTNELEYKSKHDRKRHKQRILDSHVEGKFDAKETTPQEIDEKIYLSGPLLGPSNNVDQMLREHDRRLQEYARRARADRNRLGKVGAQGRPVRAM